MSFHMKKLLLACCFTFLASHISLFAQEEGAKLSLGLSYYGNNAWNSGLNTSLEYLRLQEDDETQGGKVLIWQRLFSGNLGFYHDPGSYTALFSQVGIIRRKIFPNGFYRTFGVSPLGIYRTMLPVTYEVDDNGEVREVVAPGRFYFAPDIYLGIGKRPAGKEGMSVFLNGHLTVLLPYNTHILPLLNLEFGIRFPLMK